MFWDKVASFYDLFAYIINGKVNREMCKIITEQIKDEDIVLECACGTGLISKCIAPKCRKLIASDFSVGMLKQTERKCKSFSNVEIRFEDILDLDFSDECFDVVIAANVMHLLDDPYKALMEIERVCRPGGKLIIPTYVDNENIKETGIFTRSVGRAGADFKRQFTFSKYKDFFIEYGFKSVKTVNISGRIACSIAIIKKAEK